MSTRLVLALVAVLLAPIGAQAEQLVMLQRIHGDVAIGVGSAGQRILVAVDEAKGGEAPDGATDYVFTLDVAGEGTLPSERRFARAEIAYVIGEGRLQVISEEDGANLLFAQSSRPLMQPTGSTAKLPIDHYVTKNLGIYEGWDDTPLEAAIDTLRDSKQVILEALSQQADRPEVIAGTKPTSSQR